MRVIAVHFEDHDVAVRAVAAVRALTATHGEDWSIGQHADGWIVAGRYPAELQERVVEQLGTLGGRIEADVPVGWTRPAASFDSLDSRRDELTPA